MSPSLLEIYAVDARKYAGRLRDAMNPAKGGPNADAVRRASRRLHHAAVLANHEPVAHAAGALQKTAIQVIAGKREWSDDLKGAVVSTLRLLDAVVDALPNGDPEAESMLKDVADGLIAGDADGAGAADRLNEPEIAETGTDEAEIELNALLADLGDAVVRLQNDPRDREPLKAMLRRIRRLRELGRIEVLSPEDRALSAVEELILQIADLNATVGPGYLTVFRHAHDVLGQMRASGEVEPSVPAAADGGAEEVDQLKDRVIEKARRARQVIWVSDLFYPTGPHITSCPLAEKEAGSQEEYFLAEATRRIERSESLRRTMLEANAEQMRLAGESLALTLRHLRERAIAFDHGGMGRVTRRAAAALRAQLVRPASRIRAMAAGLGDVFVALQGYLETEDSARRAKALDDADAALNLAVLGGEPGRATQDPDIHPDAALEQMLELRRRVDAKLKGMSGEVTEGLRVDLEQLFNLMARYFSTSADEA